MQKTLLISLAALGAAGCVSVPPVDTGPVEAHLRQQLPALSAPTGHALPTGEATANDLATLLAEPLTPASAMQVALLNHAGLRAEWQSLGIAEAELVQAGLVSNPTLAVGALRPDGGGRWQLDAGLSQSLLDLLTRSLRRAEAQAALDDTRLAVAERLAGALFDIQQQWYDAVAAAEQAEGWTRVADAADSGAEFARRLHAAGNLPELEMLQARLEAQRVALQARQMRSEAERARVALAQRLGVSEPALLTLPETLPAMPVEQFAREPLLAQAQARRVDLQRAALQVQLAERYLARVLREGGWQTLEAGVAGERETDGGKLTGLTAALTLPVFDQGQARRAAAEARWRQAREAHHAGAVALSGELDQALIELDLHRERVVRLQAMQPDSARGIALLQQRYNFMLEGVPRLLDARRQDYQLQLDAAEALRDYWRARVQLARVAGGLPEPVLPTPGAPPPVETPHLHHHHTDGAAPAADPHAAHGVQP